MLTETFNWPGIGNELIQYLNARDYIAVQGLVTFFAVVVVVCSLAVDIINALVDPRCGTEMRAFIKQIWNTKGLARWIFLTGLVITVVFVVFAIFAPWIAPFDFNQTRDAAGVKFPKLQAPSGEHWLGTNDQFYDIWSRVIWGARTAVEVVVLSVVFSALIGVPLGLVSGFVGGSVDRVLVFLMDALYAFPSCCSRSCSRSC